MKIFVINRFLLCGFIGWSMECFWTGLCSIINQEDALLPCKTSVWMFPIYGFAMFIGPLSKRLRNKHWLIRGIIYALCIFFIEFWNNSWLLPCQTLELFPCQIPIERSDTAGLHTFMVLCWTTV